MAGRRFRVSTGDYFWSHKVAERLVMQSHSHRLAFCRVRPADLHPTMRATDVDDPSGHGIIHQLHALLRQEPRGRLRREGRRIDNAGSVGAWDLQHGQRGQCHLSHRARSVSGLSAATCSLHVELAQKLIEFGVRQRAHAFELCTQLHVWVAAIDHVPVIDAGLAEHRLGV
eukprot:1815524-Prymnesium_polylepis.1